MKALTDQIASARRELSMRRRVYPSWIERKRMTQAQADHEIACMEAIIKTLEFVSSRQGEPDAVRKLVAKQAEDTGLWFVAATAPEAYLQQELRRLHAAVEADHTDARAAFVSEMREAARAWVDASDLERMAIEMMAVAMESGGE